MSYFTLDSNHHPIVFIEMNGAVSEAQVEDYFTEICSVLERKERFSVVVDLSGASIPSLKVRSMLSKFGKDYGRESDAWTVSSALIVHNPAIKMAITAIYSLIPGAYPKKVFRSKDEAVSWTLGQMNEAGVACSPPPL